MDREKRAWLDDQVNAFSQRHARCENAARAWEEFLRQVVLRLGIEAAVSSRPKSLSSFAEKILRKYDKYKDPISQMTDLWGARVATYTRADMDAVCLFLDRLDERGDIAIDRENSCDTGDRLKPGEFGYRARHYIVRVPKGGNKVLGVSFGPDIRQDWGEIQVTTQLQHVWSLICHDRVYKAALNIPRELERELSAVNAMLEAAEDQFTRSIDAIDRYIGEFDPQLTPKQIEDQIIRLDAVLRVEPNDVKPAIALSRLLRRAGHPRRAFSVLRSFKPFDSPLFHREMGLVCLSRNSVKRGRMHLEKARALDPTNVELLCDLGESWLPEDATKACSVLHHASKLAADDPRVLTAYAESLQRSSGSNECLNHWCGIAATAISECERRARLGVNLPEAHFYAGRLELMRGDPERALYRYARAVIATTGVDAIETELAALTRITNDVGDRLPPEWGWAGRFLMLAVLSKAQSSEDEREGRKRLRQLRAVAIGKAPRFVEPVAIVAGGCDASVAGTIRQQFGPLLRKAFENFNGTVIGGGTTAGVSGLVANLLSNEDRIKKIGYRPKLLQSGDREAAGYDQIRIIKEPSGHVYSPLGPLQTWIDLLLAGIKPEHVRVLGFNGGRLSAVEYWIAAALGAAVGIVEDSGREGTAALRTADLDGLTSISPLCNDAATIAAFINRAGDGRSSRVAPYLEHLGEMIHEEYRQSNFKSGKRVHPSMKPWDKLDEKYKRSNIEQAAYAERILNAAGYLLVPKDQAAKHPPFDHGAYEREVETMAELEHGRYCAERLTDGWRRGPNDPDRKLNPSIVPWEALDKLRGNLGDVKQYDRDAVRNFPDLMASVGLAIVPAGMSKSI